MNIGIFNLHMRARGGGEKRTLVLAEHLSRKHRVWLIVGEPLDRGSLERYFDVDLSRVHVVVLSALRFLYRCLVASGRLLPQKWAGLPAELCRFQQLKALKLDIFINNSYESHLVCPAPRGIYMCMFPHPIPDQTSRSVVDRAKRCLLGRDPDALNSYAIVTANSRYTSDWVETLWGREAMVVYSVCDPAGAMPVAGKEKIILHVGRFFASDGENHHKRQDVLLEVFKRIRTVQEAGWQLHFAGSIAEDPQRLEFTVKLMEAARGYPVFFHFNIKLEALRDLYRRASLYWHATGYGFPADEHPGRQEHFGITTVEAMSAGAVPVVINSGGQPEIVAHGVNGLLWDDLQDLVDHTQLLIRDPQLRQRLSRQAVHSSARFSRAAFTAKMDQILDSALALNP